MVATKCKSALAQGLQVIACIGETLQERESGQTKHVIRRQLNALRAALQQEEQWQKVVLAYEPVWAIGTGKVATPAQVR